MGKPIDTTTQTVLRFLAKELQTNQFLLRSQLQAQKKFAYDAGVTRRKIAEIKRRFNRELDRYPELRKQFETESDTD